jgi:hypothetical protein
MLRYLFDEHIAALIADFLREQEPSAEIRHLATSGFDYNLQRLRLLNSIISQEVYCSSKLPLSWFT